jgi:acetoin:2,6-dichlorophenolindophenol oxidoreductase subunit beta
MSTAERSITYATAINEALREEMRRDDAVMLLGEDVGAFGGVYKVTEGLQAEFGTGRVIDTPISEAGFTGLGVGAAMTGSRPVVEIMFGDFLFLAMDQIVNQAAKVRYMSGGGWTVPLVVRTTMGAGRRAAAQHSQSLHSVFAHFPGLKLAVPATPHDAKGMLKAAIRDPDPVLIFEHKLLYREKGPVPEDDYVVPLGSAEVRRSGSDVTIVAIARMVGVALSAASELAERGVEAEVVDVRSLAPLDLPTLANSVRKTGRCVVLDEGHRMFGATGEIAAELGREAFAELKAPIERVAAADVPIPFSPNLEDATVPDVARVTQAVLAVMK